MADGSQIVGANSRNGIENSICASLSGAGTSHDVPIRPRRSSTPLGYRAVNANRFSKNREQVLVGHGLEDGFDIRNGKRLGEAVDRGDVLVDR